jgi:hypothetical protein
MAPPTIGHEKLISCLVETAKSYGADHKVFLSQTHKPPNDPLEWSFKLRVCQAAFPGVSISRDSSIKTPFHALESFKGKYDKVFLVVGDDRVEEFTSGMTPYANKWGFIFEVISAGKRNPLLEGAEGISATKLREFAMNGEDEKFLANLPKAINKRVGELLLQHTKKGLKQSI